MELISQKSTAKDAVINLFRNTNCPLRDKHEALLSIIRQTKDERVCVTRYSATRPEEISLHSLVMEYISEQRSLEVAFFADEPETVYLAEYQQVDTGEYTCIREPSLTWKACAHLLKEYLDLEITVGPHRIIVTKFYPKQSVNGFMKEMTVELNENGELMEIGSYMMMTIPHYRDLFCKMESLSQI